MDIMRQRVCTDLNRERSSEATMKLNKIIILKKKLVRVFWKIKGHHSYRLDYKVF